MRVHVDPDSTASPMDYVGRHYAHALVSAAAGFSRATYEHSKLSLREFEAARTRVAQINGCQLCQNWRSARDTAAYVAALGGGSDTVASRDSVAPDEAFYAAIADWRATTLLTARERCACEFAERFSQEPQVLAADEQFWRRARDSFRDEEIVDLSYCVACWMGLGRVAHVLGIDAACQIPALAAA
jgi:alkylhydroperoxidase family enzyme